MCGSLFAGFAEVGMAYSVMSGMSSVGCRNMMLQVGDLAMMVTGWIEGELWAIWDTGGSW